MTVPASRSKSNPPQGLSRRTLPKLLTRYPSQLICRTQRRAFHNELPLLHQNEPPRIPTEDLDFDPTAYNSLPRDFGANQHMHVDDAVKERLRSMLWEFRAHIRYAVAYGSGVFSQGTYSGKQPMIDLIFGVSLPQHWHSLNLQQHPEHYSFLGKFGSAAVAYVQDKIGAGVYYNPYVDVNGTV